MAVIYISRTTNNKISLKNEQYIHLRIRQDASLGEIAKVLAWAAKKIDIYNCGKNTKGVLRAKYTPYKFEEETV